MQNDTAYLTLVLSAIVEADVEIRNRAPGTGASCPDVSQETTMQAVVALP
jgi:hypothetical protein